MKKLLIVLCMLFAYAAQAQIVSGLYSGKLVNDSTKKVQTYEMALSEYRGKITGYSYTTFVVNDTFYYSVKRIKATKEGDQLIVEDDKMIVNNFPESPARHVRQVNTIQLTNEDTLRTANGSWKTTQTKIYYSIHGGVDIRRDNDSARSPLIAHLKELNIISTEDTHIADATPAIKRATVKEKEEKVKVRTVSDKKLTAAIAPKEPVSIPYGQRKNNLMQTIEVTADSLVISFYDNGIIDGDSISVYLNGRNIISNNRLTAVATKKTISINNLGDEIQLLVVANNLGTIPPNTGLVIVKDGDKSYQVNFTADLQTNASIVFKKQKK